MTQDASTRTRPMAGAPKFYSVATAAEILCMSAMTLYRAINAGEFPAVRVRGRLIIPARAIDEMVDGAIADGRPVDAANWAARQGDRGSAMAAASAGFALFLVSGALALWIGFAAAVLLTMLIVVGLVAVVARILRGERRANRLFHEAFPASHTLPRETRWQVTAAELSDWRAER